MGLPRVCWGGEGGGNDRLRRGEGDKERGEEEMRGKRKDDMWRDERRGTSAWEIAGRDSVRSDTCESGGGG